MLRSVAVLHVLKYYLYWISALGVSHVMRSINVRYLLTYLLTSNYGVSTLSLDDGSKFRQPISTQHLEATTGMFTFFLFCCVCATSHLSTFHTDRCRLWLLPVFRLCEVVPCIACMRWILCITYVALNFLCKTIAYVAQKPPYVVAVVEFCVYLIHLSL